MAFWMRNCAASKCKSVGRFAGSISAPRRTSKAKPTHHLPNGHPAVCFAPKRDAHQDAAQLDPRAEHAPHRKDTVASSKPSEEGRRNGNLLIIRDDRNADEGSKRLCRET
eukprot:250149-Prymnesium_polylepis.2